MKIKRMIKTVLPDSWIVKIKENLDAVNYRKMADISNSVYPFEKDKYPYGINLIGDIKAETGLGQSLRILAQMLEKCNIPFCIKQINSPGGLEHSETKWNFKISEKLIYGVNLIHVNPNVWAETYGKFEKEMLDFRYNIAFWLWELEEFPNKWVPCIDTVNEIWTPSEFIGNSIRKKTCKKVVTVPYYINLHRKNLYTREHFGLPKDKFLFLVMYDFKSISERKNPKAVLDAYKQAYPTENPEVGLVVKVNHLKGSGELKKLRHDLDSYKNIYFLQSNLSREEVESLIAASDVLVSLHRSEGFGLPVAEAMYLGTPAIVTNWSATTEFTDNKSACLVDYELVKIKRDIGPYEKGNRWAEAAGIQAAEYMARLYSDKKYYQEVKAGAEKKVRETLGSDKFVDTIVKRMKDIYDEEDSVC